MKIVFLVSHYFKSSLSTECNKLEFIVIDDTNILVTSIQNNEIIDAYC